MKNILIFSGTSEGRRLASKLAETKISSIVSVATEYGNEVMENFIKKSEYISVHTGRMDINQMEDFISENNCGIVVDATHPFAVEVSENIKRACLNCNVQMIRCLRESVVMDLEKSDNENIIYVNSLDEAVNYLNATDGNIFVTTGSKEIGKIADNINNKDRLYARVLPNTEAIGLCERAGIKGAKIYAMQGPFDEETNRLMLRLSGSKYLLTKESGSAGGFDEKISAAIKENVIAVVIKRPSEQGLSLEKTLEKILQLTENDLQNNGDNIKLTLVGIGMGSGKKQLTGEAAETCSHAGIIFGAERILESLSWCNAKKVALYSPDKILEYLNNHESEKIANIVVAFSGDTGFYSGAKAFLELENADIKILPGITTVQYFAAKLGISWQDIELCSIHGRNSNLINKIKHGGKIFSLVSSAEDVKKIAESLIGFGIGGAKMYVAVNLSYDDERIYIKKASEFIDFEDKGLIAFIIENTCKDEAEAVPYFHIPDEFFTRSKVFMKNVPMTKAEIRAVSVAKLMLKPDSVVYDVGAGTGSVSVECANISVNGQVYAIEKNPEAVKLIGLNKKKAVCENLHVIEGKAPDALESLPAPTHAFIGGSSGSLMQILDILYSKNPKIRIVINAITLETQSEILSYIKDKNMENVEIITMQVSRSENIASYHMMKGENPVMIATL